MTGRRARTAEQEQERIDALTQARRRLAELVDTTGKGHVPTEPSPDNAPEADACEGGTAEQAKEACLRLLAVRARSRAELGTRLADKGFAEDVAEPALDRLTEVGLIDDSDFAMQWVQSRHTYSGKGRQALADELRRKGVPSEIATAALDTISTDDEHIRATEMVRRKLRTIPAELARDTKIRRLVGMLARRGYPQSIAYTVVKTELDADARSDSVDDPSQYRSTRGASGVG